MDEVIVLDQDLVIDNIILSKGTALLIERHDRGYMIKDSISQMELLKIFNLRDEERERFIQRENLTKKLMSF